MAEKEIKTAIIMGGGPAGVIAAYEMIKNTDIKPIIFEASPEVGGIAKSLDFNGSRLDIGPHRFFSKSDRVMNCWSELLPIQGKPSIEEKLLKKETSEKYKKTADGPDPCETDKVMLIKDRMTRIFFLKKFFDYPVSLSLTTFKNLGLIRVFKIGLSYIWIRLFPIRKEKSLEDFFINRFGKELYLTFFKDYTQKVWGVPCSAIKPEWGAQRVKKLSIAKTVWHALKKLLPKGKESLEQKKTETSLIERFMYPKLGAGQVWEEAANKVLEKGGELHLNSKIVGLKTREGMVTGVVVENSQGRKEYSGDYYLSSLAIKDIIDFMGDSVPENVKKVSDGLVYRDMMNVSMFLKKLKLKNTTKVKTLNDIIPDNWIYIQEREVKIGRLQIFNNWSLYALKDRDLVTVGLEYFCTEGDAMWNMTDDEMIKFATGELIQMNMIDSGDVVDARVVRVKKTYPAYFGSYDNFDEIKNFTNKYENLFLVGRNGMHKYNNMDHSMLTAMTAVDNIRNGVKTKDNLWEINTEEDYHESK